MATGGRGRDDHDLDRGELEAVLAARRELGPEYEPALVDSFVEKVEAAIEARVEAQSLQARRKDEADVQRHKQQLVLGLVSLGTGIPITAVAGGVGDGLPGVLVAWAGIAVVNIAHALQGRTRR
jgi:hypothetical protein